MLLLGIELLNMRLEGQCLNHWAIWASILCQQNILIKNNFTYRGIFAIYTHKQLVVHHYWMTFTSTNYICEIFA